MKRRISSLSPLVATLLLTAAIFLLPATGDGRQAQASVDNIKVSAVHTGFSAGLAGAARK